MKIKGFCIRKIIVTRMITVLNSSTFITGLTVYQTIWYFIIYSFLGWCLEVIYQAVKRGRIINRGFLCGPVCPVYGFGMLAVLALTKSVLPALTGMSETMLTDERSISGILAVFFGGMLLTTAVELFAGWILDIAFHARWWDYSNEPLNFHGYICFRFSVMWGIAVVFVVRIVQPIMEDSATYHMPEKYGIPLLAALCAVYFADFIVTVMIVAGLNKRLQELDQVQKHLSIVSDELSTRLGSGTIHTQQKIEESKVQITLAKYEARDELAKRRSEFEEKKTALENQRSALVAKKEEIIRKITGQSFFGHGRILSAFPNMKHRIYDELLQDVRKIARGITPYTGPVHTDQKEEA